jgi:asparagine synthase (glutamine-hydrolysing)
VCGIIGTFRTSGASVARERLLALAGELRHRGPDGLGLFLDGSCGMAAARLAVVDLVHGDQPLADSVGRFWVVQNGEIYNYVELRAELERLGRRFETTCDTEVLVNAYAEWGRDCLHRLNGDFAFAVWDTLERELFLARDRFGVRPLFVTQQGGDFWLASEARALLRLPGARRELDAPALAEYVVTWGNPSGRSSFAGIRELLPGCWMTVGRRGIGEPRRWWELDFSEEARGADDGLLEELRELLDDAVRIRLRADVPVAAYVSGGLDSAVVAALARRHATDRLRLFGVGFDDERYDESPHQLRLAAALDADLTQTMIGQDDIVDLLPAVVELAERPTLRTAPAPLLQLASVVRAHETKVVLTGEGADELFAGYDIFREAKVRRFCARDPESRVRPQLYTRLNAYLGRDLGRVGAFLGRFYARGLTDTDDPLYSHRIRFANGARILGLFRREFLDGYDAADAVDPLLARLPTHFDRFGPLGQAQFLEVTTFLEGYLLHTQADRMLMGHSVEGRFPYLDYRVAEFAARLPARLRLTGLREKVGLRRAARTFVPELDTRPKWPYRAPIAGPLLAGTDGRLAEVLAPERVEAAGILDSAAVTALLSKLRGRPPERVSENEEMALAAALSTMLLHDRFVASPRVAAPLLPTKVVERPGDAGAAATVWVAG